MSEATFNPQLIAGLQKLLAEATRNAHVERHNADDYDRSAAQCRQRACTYDEQAAQYRHLLRIADPDNAHKYADPAGKPSAQDYSRRAAIIAGMREAIDFLDANPELPIENLGTELTLFPLGADDLASEAEVDRIGRIMGVHSGRPQPNRHYRAERRFGPGGYVTLQSYACGRTISDWKEGDPYPEWWPTAEAVDAAAEFAKTASAAGDVDAVAQELAETIGQTEAELARRKAAEAEAPGDAPDVEIQCSANTVCDGELLFCIRNAGHNNALLTGYDARLSRHFNPDIGEFDELAEPDVEALDEGMVSMGALGEVDV